MKTRETGRREKLTVLVPFSPGNEIHEAALDALRYDLALMCGGHSEYEGNGGWLDPETGATEREYHLKFEVSFEPDVEFSAEWIISHFVAAGRACGNTWLHIERSTFEAEHRKVR